MIHPIVAVIVFFLPILCYGQTTVKGVNAEAVIEVSEDITLEMARNKALNKAFAEALEIAGVSFHVRSSTLSNTVESGDYFRDLFLVASEISMQGNIVNYTIEEDIKYVENNTLYYKIGLVADIIMYQTQPDKFFKIEVTGLSREYKEGAALRFTFTSSQDAYLYIFSLSNDSLTALYPNAYESRERLLKNTNIAFPISNRINYEVEKEGDQSELIFIAVKDRFDELLTANSLKDLLLSYNTIEPFNKCFEFHRFWVD